MQPEREGAAAKTPPGDGSRSTNVQHAVEQFVELHATGKAPDPATYAGRFAEDMRKAVLLQCREFLAFDGLLGHQEWEPAPPKETQGRAFGDFVIQEELGRGGMGVVYLAHQKSLNRRIALKVMASGLTLSKRHVERFRREAAAAAQLHHPAIVAVHALTEIDGTFALAMDYVAGRNLADILDDLRLANGEAPTAIEGTLGLAPEKGYVAECAMFVAELASALAVAHQANVVHRDLKPRNLMLDDRRQVRLLDFGLAKSLGEGSISMSGEITGTAHYMSPEQTLAKRVEVDHRADIWALGVILYEVLTLRRPFDGKNLQQVVYEICFQEPVPLQKRNHKVPRDLVTICQKALEKDPNKRYQSAGEFEADLQRFLRWEPIHARPASAMTRLLKLARRRRTETALAAVLLLGGLTTIGWSMHVSSRADELLVAAAAAEEGGDSERAAALASQALELRNDETTRAKLKSYSEKNLRNIAEAHRDAMESAQLKAHNREQAIQLALAAVGKHASPHTRSAVLDALGSGGVARTLLSPDSKSPRLVGARWSPDGKAALLFGYGGHAQIWDPATARPIATLVGHHDQATVVGGTFLGDERLATVAIDKTLRFWARRGEILERSVPLPGIPATLQADAAGRRLLITTYGSDKGPYLAQVHDAATGTAISAAVAHKQLFVATALSRDGACAATCSGDGVRVWDAATGLPTAADNVPVHGRVRALAFAPDNSLLAIACGREVILVRVQSGEVVGHARHSQEITAAAFDATSQRLLTGARDLTARLWSLAPEADSSRLSVTEVATLVGHRGSIDHVAFDPSNQFALTATGGINGDLAIFDVDAGREPTSTAVHRYEAGPSILAAEWSPNGRGVLALAGAARPLVWDLGGAHGVLTIRQTGWAGAVAFDANGSRLVTGGSDERLRLWSTTDGSLLWTSADLGQPQTRIDVDDAGERIACSGLRDDTVHVLRLADGEPLFTLQGHGKGIAVVRFPKGGSRLLTAGTAKSERGAAVTGLCILWNTNDHTRAFELARPRPVIAADLDTDGMLMATVEEEQTTVQLWAVPSGESRGQLKGHSAAITSVRFAPDGKTLLTTSRDRSTRLWDTQGKLLHVLPGKQPQRCAAFSRDGTTLLTCGEGSKSEAKLWRTADGTALLTFGGHNGDIDHGAFHPDGSVVATTARDGTVCLWPTDPVAVARRLLPTTNPAAPAPAASAGK